jgi:hypothetical protein
MTPEPMFYPDRRPPEPTAQELSDLGWRLALYTAIFVGGLLVGWAM